MQTEFCQLKDKHAWQFKQTSQKHCSTTVREQLLSSEIYRYKALPTAIETALMTAPKQPWMNLDVGEGFGKKNKTYFQ